MRLYHTTYRANCPSITTSGLLTSYSRGALPVVYLHTCQRIRWADYHVQWRHDLPPVEIVCYAVDVPRSWLSRRLRGLWACWRDIPVERITLLGERKWRHLARTLPAGR